MTAQPHAAAAALNEALYDGDYDPSERAALIGAHRAAVLREAADKLEADCRDKSGGCFCTAAGPLRRMADEAVQR